MRLTQLQKDNAVHRSAAANEARREHQPTTIDWDQAITHLHDMFNDREPRDRL